MNLIALPEDCHNVIISFLPTPKDIAFLSITCKNLSPMLKHIQKEKDLYDKIKKSNHKTETNGEYKKGDNIVDLYNLNNHVIIKATKKKLTIQRVDRYGIQIHSNFIELHKSNKYKEINHCGGFYMVDRISEMPVWVSNLLQIQFIHGVSNDKGVLLNYKTYKEFRTMVNPFYSVYNITTSKISECIEKNYLTYNGYKVVHSTDKIFMIAHNNPYLHKTTWNKDNVVKIGHLYSSNKYEII